MTENDLDLVRGIGNVFRDFNDPHADLGRLTLDRLIKMLAALDGSLRVTVHVASEPSGRRR